MIISKENIYSPEAFKAGNFKMQIKTQLFFNLSQK
jgi:hypothetical protein